MSKENQIEMLTEHIRSMLRADALSKALASSLYAQGWRFIPKETSKAAAKSEKAVCGDCKYWNLCRGMLHDGIDCYEPSDSTIVQDTIIAMLEKFGEDSQIDVSIEEMSELTKELIKYKRSKIHFRERQAASRDHVVEEIGDVMFMMEYMKHVFGISEDEIRQTIVQKAIRTKRRYIDAKDN